MTTQQTIESVTLVGKSDSMHQIYKMIGRLCNSDCSILLLGEPGVGKGTVARALHDYSQRSAEPFRTIQGSEARESSDEDLLGLDESHRTDSTCYLRDWTSLPIFVHDQLLKIHNSKHYHCTHQNRPRKHNLRFIAATSRNLREELENGKIPMDLFYDWNFLPIYIPPLRDRREDIPEYAGHMLEKLSKEKKVSLKELSPEAREVLIHHDWPGNLTELKSVLETSLQNCRGNYIRTEHLPDLKKSEENIASLARLELFLNSKLTSYIQGLPTSFQGNLYPFLMPHLEKAVFQYALRKSHGNKNKAARLLGVHRNTLNKKLQRLEPA